MFLGIPFIIIGVILMQLDGNKEEILMKSINSFSDGKELDQMIQIYLSLVERRHDNREKEIILKGYIISHEKNCLFRECPLSNAKKIINSNNNSSGNEDFFNNSPNIQSELLSYINKVYIFGLIKFNNCTSLMISYAIFLINFLKHKLKAKSILENAERDNPPFNEQFIIFRYKKHIIDEQDFSNNFENDLVNGIAYESHFRQFKTTIQNTAKIFFDFWEILSENSESTPITKLNNIGQKIQEGLRDINTHW